MDDIMHQALTDEFSVVLDGDGYEARFLYGCKIMQDNETKEIKILNTALGGEWYKPVDFDLLEVFLQKGWRFGVYELSLSNYRIKLDKVERSIKKEMNGRKNPKQIQSLKMSRQNILERYSKIKSKLNLISND
jgi:hypothetical protein